MSTVTLTTEIAREFREADPTSPVSVTAAEIRMFLNWAYQDLCCTSRPIRESATKTITAEQSIYALPNDCILPTEVWVGDKKLGAIDYYEKDDVDPHWRTSRSTKCEQYIPLGYDKIELYPIKTSAGTITYHGYYAMPATLSVTQDPEIPLHHQRAMKKYVLAILHASKSRNIKLATQYLQEYYGERLQWDASSRDGQVVDRQTQSGPMFKRKYERIRKDR